MTGLPQLSAETLAILHQSQSEQRVMHMDLYSILPSPHVLTGDFLRMIRMPWEREKAGSRIYVPPAKSKYEATGRPQVDCKKCGKKTDWRIGEKFRHVCRQCNSEAQRHYDQTRRKEICQH